MIPPLPLRCLWKQKMAEFLRFADSISTIPRNNQQISYSRTWNADWQENIPKLIWYDMTTLFSVGKNNYNLGFHN